jgi:hypothetical protein
MTERTPFQLVFVNGRTALVVAAERMTDLPSALMALGLGGPRRVIMLVEGR